MRLEEASFNAIASGDKTVEVRLNDNKRNLLKPEDKIEFYKRSLLKEKVIVEVVKLDRFSTFKELVGSFPLENFGTRRFKTKDELLRRIREVYSIEQESKYGALAIHIKLI